MMSTDEFNGRIRSTKQSQAQVGASVLAMLSLLIQFSTDQFSGRIRSRLLFGGDPTISAAP